MARPARHPNLRHVAIALAATAGAVGVACSSGTEPVVQTLPPGTAGTGTTGTTSSHGAGSIDREPTGTATISSFDVRNQISCAGAVDVTTGATYATEGTASVSFLVDGNQVPGSPPTSGTFDIPVACDGRSHTVVLVAVDPDGGTTVDSRVVLTTTTPQGN